MVKHIFLTGSIQVGKSTLIRSVLSDIGKEQNDHFEFDGFVTYFDYRKNESRKLYMERKTSDRFAEKIKFPVIQFEGGRPQMSTLAYETYGVGLLEKLDVRKMLIFDECGKFEKNCPMFIGKVEEILNKDTHVFGVLRKDDSIEWLKNISKRNDVCVIEVTEGNRENLRYEVKKQLLEVLGE